MVASCTPKQAAIFPCNGGHFLTAKVMHHSLDGLFLPYIRIIRHVSYNETLMGNQHKLTNYCNQKGVVTITLQIR